MPKLLLDHLLQFLADAPLLRSAHVPDETAESGSDLHPIVDAGDGVEREKFADRADYRAGNNVASEVIDLDRLQVRADVSAKFLALFGWDSVLQPKQECF